MSDVLYMHKRKSVMGWWGYMDDQNDHRSYLHILWNCCWHTVVEGMQRREIPELPALLRLYLTLTGLEVLLDMPN